MTPTNGPWCPKSVVMVMTPDGTLAKLMARTLSTIARRVKCRTAPAGANLIHTSAGWSVVYRHCRRLRYGPDGPDNPGARRKPRHRTDRQLMHGNKEAQPTVFVVEDDEQVRKFMRTLLSSVGLNTAAFGSAQDFLTSYNPQQSGCLVLDVRMPGMSGLELQQLLNMRGAILPVIFVSGHGDIPMAVEAMQHGAFDFLPKPFRDQDLIDRVQRALEKDKATALSCASGTASASASSRSRRASAKSSTLVTSGKANKVMAADLGVSQRTVEIHRARVMEKMGAASLAQLVRMVMDLQPTA